MCGVRRLLGVIEQEFLGGRGKMTDFIYEDAFEPDVNIKVIGVGGGGAIS